MYALVGVAAMLAGNCRVPLTSVLLLFELTRDYFIILVSWNCGPRSDSSPLSSILLWVVRLLMHRLLHRDVLVCKELCGQRLVYVRILGRTRCRAPAADAGRGRTVLLGGPVLPAQHRGGGPPVGPAVSHQK